MAEVLTYLLLFLTILTSNITNGESLELLLFHSNNIFSHFKENSVGVGGVQRALHFLKKARKEAELGKGPPVLYFHAGDNFCGSYLYRESIADILNILAPDAACLGNHDFDEGPLILKRLLQRLHFPIVGTNVKSSNSSVLSQYIRPHHIIHVRNWTIGVVGYTTTRTNTTSFPGGVSFTDEIEAVKRACRLLKDMGAKIIVALGHAGYKVDKRIAEEVPEVNIVVGAHRKAWMHVPRKLIPPEVHRGYRGKKTIIITEPGYLEYLGMVRVTFDDDGRLLNHSGRPIHLQGTPEAKIGVNLLRLINGNKEHEYVGKTRVVLSGRCLASECNLANLLLDAMCDYQAERYQGEYWTEYAIAIINGGSFRNSINVANGMIFDEHLHNAMHFNDYLCGLDLKGRYLKQALEQGVRWDESSTGELLHMAGLHVTYNFSKPKGARITRIYVRCASCRVPRYTPLMKDEMYKLLTTNYVSQGIDGHISIRLNMENYWKADINVKTLLKNYIKNYKLVSPDVEDRFVILNVCVKSEVNDKLLLVLLISIRYIKLFYHSLLNSFDIRLRVK